MYTAEEQEANAKTCRTLEKLSGVSPWKWEPPKYPTSGDRGPGTFHAGLHPGASLVVLWWKYTPAWRAGLRAVETNRNAVGVPFVEDEADEKGKPKPIEADSPVEALRLGLERLEAGGLFVSAHRYRVHFAGREADGPTVDLDVAVDGQSVGKIPAAVYDLPISVLELPPNVSIRAATILRSHGLDTLGKVVARHPGDLKRMRGFGTACLDSLIDALARYDLKLGDLYVESSLEKALGDGVEDNDESRCSLCTGSGLGQSESEGCPDCNGTGRLLTNDNRENKP